MTDWADLTRALMLFAADPAGLGGLVLRGYPGPVRDHALALLRDVLPPNLPIRRLPPACTDTSLLGGLDLAATLQAGKPVQQPGLLREARDGVVIIPMAERLEAAAVPRLLNGQQAWRFGIVALDEGLADEAPPFSLLDSLAFHIDLTGLSWRDIAAEAEPFSDSGSPVDGAPHEGDGIDTLCAVAAALGVTSLRAALIAVRAARLAARMAGRESLSATDLQLAARLVLAPRATQVPAPPEPPPPEDAPEDGPDDSPEPESDLTAADMDMVLEAARAALPPGLLALAEAGRGQARSAGKAGKARIVAHRGRPIGSRPGAPRNGARLHLLETLKAAAPWQRLRSPPPGRLAFQREDFRIIRFRQRTTTTTIFAVDASGSAALHRLAEAKGAVELLLADCYVRRDQVALIAFRGQDAMLLLPPTRSLVRAKRSLAALPGGGATPLAAGLRATAALAETERRAGRSPVIVLLTDGRANIGLSGEAGRAAAEADALLTAEPIAAMDVQAVLVDTAPRPNPFAGRLASAMQARYVTLPHADATALSAAAWAGTRAG